MATAGSEVTTNRVRQAAQSNYSHSIYSSGETSLEEAFHPRNAVSSPPLAHWPSDDRPSDDIVSWRLKNHPLDCRACQDLLGESGLPMECLGLPLTKPSSPLNSSEMANEAIGINDEPTHEPTQEPTHSRYHASLLPRTNIARCLGYITSIPSKVCHRWLGSLLGLSSLALAIVSLLMYSIRSYRMAVWTTRNDELQTCTGLIQAERPIGPNCERLISEGPQDPPYNLSRRMTYSGSSGSFFNLSDISVVGTEMFLPVETEHSAWLIFASIFAFISLADLLLNLLRQRSRTKDDVESLAAIGIATLPHHDQSSTIIDNDHTDAWFPFAYTNPSIGIRRRIRHQQEGQDETSIEDQSIGEEGLPYSMARYLNQSLPHGAIGEMPFLS